MNYYGYEFIRETDLRHYGLKGMHWGTRRWQNPDGTFNSAGKQRYFSRGTGEDYRPVSKSSSGRRSEQPNNAQALARQYRRDHPSTKLSDREIARNMGYSL